MLGLRQHHNHPNAFGRSDIYAVCRLSPLSFEINWCSQEISFCDWMAVDDFVLHEHTTAFGKCIGKLLLHGLKNGFDTVDITVEELEYPLPSRRKTYKLFTRPLRES